MINEMANQPPDITPLLLYAILAIACVWNHLIEMKENKKINQKKTKFTELDGRLDCENGLPYCNKGQAHARGYYNKYTDEELKEVLKHEKKRRNDQPA